MADQMKINKANEMQSSLFKNNKGFNDNDNNESDMESEKGGGGQGKNRDEQNDE